MRVIIVGGGIGGVTTAIALRRAGLDAHVYERAPAPAEVGAGIALWANAITALRMIDAADDVEHAGERAVTAEIRTSTGRCLKRTSLERIAGRAGAPMVLIHRAELLDALLGRLGPDAVTFGAECVDASQTADRVTARFGNGHETSADVLIGADGIHSSVRRAVLGDSPVRYCGYTCWRGVTEFPYDLVPPGYVAEVWGRGTRFGITRIGRGRIYWWATTNAAPNGRNTDERAALLSLYRTWPAPIPALVEATPPDRVLRSDIIDRTPSRPWGRGRAVLLGDAAHATTPNLGQGGCMAIEDGVVLARLLAGARDAGGALREFEQQRFARTRMVTRRSHTLGWWGQTESRLLAWMRNTTLALLPRRAVEASNDALVKFTG